MRSRSHSQSDALEAMNIITPPETPVAKASGNYNQGLVDVAIAVKALGGAFKRETRWLIGAVALGVAVCLVAIGAVWWSIRGVAGDLRALAAQQQRIDTAVEKQGITTEATKVAVDDAAELVAAKPQVDIEVVPPPASASASSHPKAVVVIRPRPRPSAASSASAPPAPSVVIPLEVPSGPTPKGKP